MGWLTNLLGGAVDDPVLGRLEHRDGVWSGEVDWHNNAHPAGLFYRGKIRPDAAFRTRVESIKQTAKRLEREMQQKFYDLWQSGGNTIEHRYTRADTPYDLWRLLHMTGLNLDDTPQAALIYSFRDEALSEVCFEAVIEDGKLVSVDIDF